jgi:DNA mismatch repair ATPase MutS
MPKTSSYLATVSLAPLIFGHYATVLQTVAKEDFANPHLQKIQSNLKEAVSAISALDLIINRTSVKSFGLFYYLLNMLLLWDFDCAIRLSNWKERYGNKCEFWLKRLGELESLLSLAVLGNTCSEACLPEVTTNTRQIKAQQLGHPLLPNQTRICNDFEQQEQLLLISGSNMSGKTTFLRTVGINLTLARSGGYVCAQSLQCASFQLISSMRIRDDLSEGISTFYAELRQIARIVSAAKSEGDLFFLIDEIFRGTNSEDRLAGATAVIGELSRRRAMGMVTTHDLSLCDLETSLSNLRNYSFAENYSGDSMFFDYRLRIGKSTSTNAQFLMRQVGIELDLQEK